MDSGPGCCVTGQVAIFYQLIKHRFNGFRPCSLSGTGFIFTRPGTEGMQILLPEARILPRASVPGFGEQGAVSQEP